MTSETKKRRHISLFLLIIIISILLHVIGLFLFLSWKYETNFFNNAITPAHDQQRKQQPSVPEMHDNQHDDSSDMPAELRSRASSFGAPVVFQDMPDQQEQQKTEEQKDVVEKEEETTQQETTESEKAQEPVQEIQEEPATHNDMEPSPEQTTQEEPSPDGVQIAPTPAAPQRKKRRKKKKVTSDLQTDMHASQSHDQPSMTFAQLAQGFLDTLDQGGQDWFSRKGDPKKRPDFEELKYLSYTQKIAWYLQQAWHAQPPTITRAVPNAVLYVHLIINKEGELVNLIVLQNSGVDEFDTAILQGIRTAGPFPPLPEHFKKELLDIKFGIHLTAEQSRMRVSQQRRTGRI